MRFDKLKSNVPRVPFTKPAIPLEQQVALLCQRGMGGDPSQMREALSKVGYYRMSAYWYGLWQEGRERFREGASFHDVWSTCQFDRHLRLLTMAAIEHIEVFLRGQVAYHHALRFGPFGYVNPASLPDLKDDARRPARTEWFATLAKEVERSREEFVSHFKDKYEEGPLPIWMAVEVLPLGSVIAFFRGCPVDLRQAIADHFGLDQRVFASWLLSVNTVRNICAHHGRLWNRDIRTQPEIPRARQHQMWTRAIVNPKRTFATLSFLNMALRALGAADAWPQRLPRLLAKFPKTNLQSLGMATDWAASGIWG